MFSLSWYRRNFTIIGLGLLVCEVSWTLVPGEGEGRDCLPIRWILSISISISMFCWCGFSKGEHYHHVGINGTAPPFQRMFYFHEQLCFVHCRCSQVHVLWGDQSILLTYYPLPYASLLSITICHFVRFHDLNSLRLFFILWAAPIPEFPSAVCSLPICSEDSGFFYNGPVVWVLSWVFSYKKHTPGDSLLSSGL